MSILPSLEAEHLLISTLLAEDDDFIELARTGRLSTIMPSYVSIEDVFQRIGYVFRADGYNVTIGPAADPFIYEDDVLFSRTLAQVGVYAKQGYDFPSRFLAGARVSVPLMDIHSKIDVAKMDAVAEELAPSFGAKYQKARARIQTLGPPLDADNLVVASAWNKYFGVCAKIMAYLRAEGEAIVNPKKPYGVEETVAALLGDQEFGHIKPLEGDKFSENENFMLKLAGAKFGGTIIEHEGREYFVRPFSAFSAISSAAASLPVEHELPLEAPKMETPLNVELPAETAECSRSITTSDVEQLVWDNCVLDMNSNKELHRLLVAGGRTQAARSLWQSVSKSRQQATARAIPTSWIPFEEAATLMAKAAEVDMCPAFLECAAARLLTMKGIIVYDVGSRRVRRK